MNPEESINYFFYNLIPGILFIIGILYLFNGFPLVFIFADYAEGIIILLTIIFGLFFGFCFQGITKIIRKSFDEEARRVVMIQNNKKTFSIYSTAKNELIKQISEKKKEIRLNRKQFFYMMHNYLRGSGHGEATMFFTARLAFWSNIFSGSCVYLFIFLIVSMCRFHHRINLFQVKQTFILTIISLPILYFSRKMFKEYLRIFNEVILHTYLSVVKHKLI